MADVVRLDRNNRILVAQGLKRMREGKLQAGVAALLRVAGREARRASCFDLGFAAGPRLNAAGRLADRQLCRQVAGGDAGLGGDHAVLPGACASIVCCPGSIGTRVPADAVESALPSIATI